MIVSAHGFANPQDLPEATESNGFLRSLAWRKALEDAGLQQALKQTGRFGPESQGQKWETSELPSDRHDVTRATPEPDMPIEAPHKGIDTEASRGHTLRPGQALLLNSRWGMQSDASGFDVGLPEKSVRLSGGRADHTQAQTSHSIRTEFQRSKVSILNNAADAPTLYIRDAAMDADRLRRVLGPLKERMATLGVSLARIVLNGHTVWDRQQTAKDINN